MRMKDMKRKSIVSAVAVMAVLGGTGVALAAGICPLLTRGRDFVWHCIPLCQSDSLRSGKRIILIGEIRMRRGNSHFLCSKACH